MVEKSYWVGVSPGPASSTHVKASDSALATATWHTGATDFLAALADSPYAITYMPPHRGGDRLSADAGSAAGVDAIILLGHWRHTLLLRSGHPG